jgi:hypothetical protein
MHDDRIRAALERQARYAELLAVEPGDSPTERRFLLDGAEVGRIFYREDDEMLSGGVGWIVEYWDGERWQRCPSELLAEADMVDDADRHGVGEVADALADGLAKPRTA